MNSADPDGRPSTNSLGLCLQDAWTPGTAPFDPAEKAWMLRVARDSIVRFVNGAPLLEPIAPPPRLLRNQSCFVTLTLDSTLRGCIGNLSSALPLCKAVAENARGAASRDPRFSPVTLDELRDLKIEISVLTDPQPVSFASPEELLGKLQPGVTGVVLRIEGLLGTFLPQVWAMVPDRVQFLNRLAEKIGFPPDAWREPGVLVSLYQVESFEEE